jgi:sigma-E factor negative regulatory protein RseB
VPQRLPAGLSLFVGSQAPTSAGPVLDLTYSDGLYVVSVFEQHGRLASRLPGWQQTKVSGTVVYADMPFHRELTWSGRGIVYTVIADAPAQVAAGVVAALPHDRPPGFWKRVTRGLARLADLVNPF